MRRQGEKRSRSDSGTPAALEPEVVFPRTPAAVYPLVTHGGRQARQRRAASPAEGRGERLMFEKGEGCAVDGYGIHDILRMGACLVLVL